MKSALLIAAALFSFNAFAEVETQEGQSPTKNEDFVGTCFTVPGTYLPGGTGSVNGFSGLKFRTAQEGKTLAFNVNAGYVITEFAAKGISNYAAKDEAADAYIAVTKVEVDGVEVAIDNVKFPTKAEGNEPAELKISNINAYESIKFYFDNVNMAGTQVVLSYDITYGVVEPEAADFADGKFYIVDKASGKYLAAGHDWGTRAIVSTNALDWTLAKVEEGIYTLDSQVSNGGASHFLGTNGYCDAGAANWTITKVGKTYTIQGEPGYLSIDADDNIAFTAEAADAAKWVITSEADAVAALIASFENASEANPVEATMLIKDANFNRNDLRRDAWTMIAGNQNLSGGNNINNCAESWQSAFTLSQKINLPNGKYAVTAQATLTDYTNAYDGADYPVVYANDVTSVFNSMDESDRATNMSTLSQSFTDGKYYVEPLIVAVTDGTLTIGVKGTRTNTWCIWDNFQLFSYGPLDEATIAIENYKSKSNMLKNKMLNEGIANDDLQAEAEELVKNQFEALRKAVIKNIPETGEEALQNKVAEVLNQTAPYETIAEYFAGIEALQQILNQQGSEEVIALYNEGADEMGSLLEKIDVIEAKEAAAPILAAMKEVVDATNVYTQEAYDEYYGQWVAKYEAGELTKEDLGKLQDPSVVTGWHANITVDNFLLSAWDTNPDFNDAAYYINSWSVEGDTDGSNFRVPFFEYWTGDANSLGEKTMTATMENVPAGVYDITAWVRVRAKNGFEAPAYGISLQGNEGTAVNVADGAQVGTSQFFLKEAKATAIVTDGVLNIKFIVAADNNISWLSFKNVKFEKVGDLAADAELAAAPEGWKSVISNGNLADEKVANFYTKENAGNPELSWITAGAGVDGSRGIVINTPDNPAQDWDAQFFITADETIPEGSKIHVEFDYKASQEAEFDTQSHYNAGNYIHWYAVGSATAKPEWQHLTVEVDVTSSLEWGKAGTKEAEGQPFQTIAFNLSKIKTATTFYFDNIIFWVQAPAAANGTTGIDQLETAQDNNVIFNLNGQKVQNAQKGLYIKNGKKVVLK